MEVTERLSTALADRYRIERHLGAGGMATVYLAYDLKHDRKVAVKVLKPELAAVLGAERFVVEIKTTASLQHPHILPLFDSGSADGFLFYVMPFVEGETLREKLNRETQLGVEEAVRIAREVADALDYAHRHGVIHRDIKPENILLHDGRPVVADFGIALAVSAAAGGRMTETGLSLGTPYYMSPEQATGDKQITGRSDIYSLASVLYEMLTGEPPHMGNSAQQIIMKIIGDTPRPVTQLRKSVPQHVAAAVAKALEKLPADRFDTAKAFADALERPGTFTVTTASSAATILDGARTSRMNPLIAAGALLLAAVVGGASWGMLAPEPKSAAAPLSRFRLQLPDDAAPTGGLGSTIALSPDGSRLVYAGIGRGRQQLFTRTMGQMDPVPIPGTADGFLPFFSPDGKWLGFRQGTNLVRMQIAGGPVMPIVSTPPSVYGASWTARDTIVYATDDGIMEVPASGGTPRLLTHPDSGSREGFLWPEVLPGDRTVVFSIFSEGVSRVAAVDRHTGKVKRLAQPGGYPRYVDGGYLVLSGLSGTIAAVRFDPARVEVSGSLITFENAFGAENGDANLAVARSGNIVYQPSGAVVTQRLVLADRNGSTRDLGATPKSYSTPRLSPDGRRVAVGAWDDRNLFSSYDIWVYDIERRVPTRLTTDTGSAFPLWTRDGRRIVYAQAGRDLAEGRAAASRGQLFSLPADGGTAPQPLPGGNGWWVPGAFLPDGRGAVLVGAPARDSTISLWLVQADSTSEPLDLTPGNGSKVSPSLSPDGRFMAYQSNESGRSEVYVRALASAETRRQVSSDGGTTPRWSPKGGEIFFRVGDNNARMMVAEVRTSPSLEVGAAKQLFEGPPGFFDVGPDGQSFLMLQPVQTQDATLVVVLNWFEELRKTAGAKRP